MSPNKIIIRPTLYKLEKLIASLVTILFVSLNFNFTLTLSIFWTDQSKGESRKQAIQPLCTYRQARGVGGGGVGQPKGI